jgi:hypothetical protein
MEVGVGGSSEEAACCSEEPKLKESEDGIVSATTRFLSRSSEEVSMELDSDSVAGVCITGASTKVLFGVSCTEVPPSCNCSATACGLTLFNFNTRRLGVIFILIIT